MGWQGWGDRSIQICSSTVPTISVGNAIITNVGVCCNNTLCVQYLLTNNSPIDGQEYVYTDLSGLSSVQTLNAYQSIIINSLSTPYSLFGAIVVSETGTPCFPSPSVTPTKTLTPTPSFQPTSYEWTSGANWWSTDILACSNYVSYASNGWTTSTQLPTVGTPLIDNGTNLPVSGQNNQWIAISSVTAPGVMVYAVAVNSNGIIIAVTLCP